MIRRFASSSLFVLSLLVPLTAPAQISISIGIAPPPLPVYHQPPPPADGYLWTPGYWAWNQVDAGYYWVPGTWVLAPRPGYLWTPGYWSFAGGGYRWQRGYWGPRVGFYGGIAYGFGYTGYGYHGGRWERGVFHYNTAVNNVNTTVVRNVYRTEVVNNTYNVRRVSYNGGAGVKAEATAEERQASQARGVDPTPNQVEHERKALKAPTQKASGNAGVPRVVATTKATALEAPDAVRGSDLPAGERVSGKDAKAKKAGADARDAQEAEGTKDARDAKPAKTDAKIATGARSAADDGADDKNATAKKVGADGNVRERHVRDSAARSAPPGDGRADAAAPAPRDDGYDKSKERQRK